MIKKYKYIYLKIIVTFISLGCLFIYIREDIVRDIVNIFIVSCVISYILKPIRNKIKQKFNINNRKASMAILLLSVVIFLCIFYIIIPTMYKEFNNIRIVFDKLIKDINELKEKPFLKKSSVMTYLYQKMQEKGTNIIESSSMNIIGNIIKFSENFLSYAIVPVVSYYILADSTRLSQKLLMIIPRKNRILIKKIIYDIDGILGKYILGQILLSGIITILTLVGMVVLKIKFPIWLSIINGIFNIIPYFGPIFGAIPIIFMAFIDSNIKGLYAMIFVFVIQQIEGNILCPKITGDSTDIHPIVIVAALVTGEKLGGFFWMLLAVPIVVIIKVAYDDINKYLF